MLGFSPVSSLPVSAIPDFSVVTPATESIDEIAHAIDVVDATVIPFIPGVVVDKVLALDAAFGSRDVARFYQTRNTERLLTNQSVAILIDCGTEFDLAAAPEFVFTKPDGATFVVKTPFGSIGRITAYTQRGIYEPSTYGVCILQASQVDQVGLWSCFLRNGIYESAFAYFFVGLLQ